MTPEERRPVTLTCEICGKTVTIAHPRSFREWASTEAFRRGVEERRQERHEAPTKKNKAPRGEAEERKREREERAWFLLSAGRFGRDVLVCGRPSCGTTAPEKLTPPEMIAENPKWRIGDYMSGFLPEHFVPDEILRAGAWPPPSLATKGARILTIRNNYVYLAGPLLGAGEAASQNIAAAVRDAQRLVDGGYIPFVPHLYFFADMIDPRPLDHWYQLDRAWLKRCGALVRRPGTSAGSDLEVRWAKDLRIPIWHGVDSFLEDRPAISRSVTSRDQA